MKLEISKTVGPLTSMAMRYRKKITDYIKLTVGGTLCFFSINYYLQNEKFYDKIVMPILHKLDPETAHNVAVKTAKYNLIPSAKYSPTQNLESKVFGLTFKTPIGLAAGFDKNGEAVMGMSQMGFSFIEVGSVTPEPQPGNHKPRLFRLSEDKAVINSYGFNSDGHDEVYKRLSQLPPPGSRKTILGVNLGKNKTSTDPIKDFTAGVKKFGSVADYLVINVSSPNTPGLRDLQRDEELMKLTSAVMATRDTLPIGHRPPVLLKIAPDLSTNDKQSIARVVCGAKSGVDGLIISNTTVQRPKDLKSSHDVTSRPGGLSGAPLRDLATETIRDLAKLTEGKVPIIGVGGVSSGEDAYDKICAGASLVQLYTALVYHGPILVPRITQRLEELLQQDGFVNVSDAIGSTIMTQTSTQSPSIIKESLQQES